ncbi:MAG: hypothetical protein KC912_15200 [Proteobacteria bacterium]|nr:hypothetical protein [Pseudomonadota bacterium]
MSYFDHVKCSSCRAQLDPESLVTIQGTARCPRCGGQISLTDLFGVADAFVGDDAPNVGIDDLVPGGPSRSRPSPSRAAPTPGRQVPARRGEAGESGGGSALDALRSMKKGRK